MQKLGNQFIGGSYVFDVCVVTDTSHLSH